MRQIPRVGCLWSLLILLLGGLALVIAVQVIANPWIFTVGGRFRLLPYWQGKGEIAGPGGVYQVFVSFFPTNKGSRVLPSTSVRGSGWICTPTGRNYSAWLGGGAPDVIWRNMESGERFSLRL